jgi:hypothetical protein
MNHTQRKILAELPSNGQHWLCITRRIPGWIQNRSYDVPWRPVLCCILDLQADVILHFGMGKSRADTPAKVASRTLFEAMTAEGTQTKSSPRVLLNRLTPSRPASIEFTFDAVHRFLKSHMDALGIQSSFAPHVMRVNEIMNSMAAASGQTMETGVLSLLRGDIFATQRFFALAAEFHRAALWRYLGNAHVIEVRYPATAEPFWVVTMGRGGEEFGLATYDSLDFVNQMFTDDHPAFLEDIDREMVSLSYSMPYDGVSTEDLDIIEQFGFAVDGENGYPALIHGRIERGEATRMPFTLQDLERMTALMQVLPEFASSEKYMAAKEESWPKPADATLTLPEDDAHGSIRLTFPPAGISFQPLMYGDPVEDEDEFEDLDDAEAPSLEDVLAMLESLMKHSASMAQDENAPRAKLAAGSKVGKPKSGRRR